MSLSSDFQIKDNRILSISANIDPDHASPSDRYKTSFAVEGHIAHHPDRKDGRRSALLSCDVHVVIRSAEHPDDDYVGISITDGAIFDISAETETDAFDRMLRLNGMATILPLIRSILSTSAAIWGIRTQVLLPNINVTKMEWASQSKEE